MCMLAQLPRIPTLVSFKFLVQLLMLRATSFMSYCLAPALEYFFKVNRRNTDQLLTQQENCYPQTCHSTVVSEEIYYSPRLDPKRYLDGPLSTNPATRLRQMLARPGIVVNIQFPSYSLSSFIYDSFRSRLGYAMA